jgi:hypothetical protein
MLCPPFHSIASDLNKDNQRILSSLINSRHTVDFLHGLVNSLRDEILGLVLITAYIACSTKLQFEYLELKANNEDDEFEEPTKEKRMSQYRR